MTLRWEGQEGGVGDWDRGKSRGAGQRDVGTTVACLSSLRCQQSIFGWFKTARESKLAGRAGDESSSLKASMLEYFGEFSQKYF